MPVCYGWFTLVLSPPNQQTTTLPKTAQESGGSSPTTSAFLHCSNLPFPPVLYPSLALCHHSNTDWTARVDTKVNRHSYYLSFYMGHILFWHFVPCSTYLPWIQTWPTSRPFFQGISQPFSSLYHLLPSLHLSCLSSEQPHGSHALCHICPMSHTKNIVLLLDMP